MSTATSLMERVNCQGCGADMIYNPEKESLYCENCGNTLPIQADQAELKPIDVEKGLLMSEEETTELSEEKILNCSGCGATFAISSRETSVKCPFCGARNTVSNNFNNRIIKPQAIIPFKIGKEKASEIVSMWLGKGFFTPSSLKKAARIDEIKGIYLPIWSFDINIEADYDVEIGYYYYVTETYTDDQGNQQTRQVRKTRWEYHGSHESDFYKDLPVLALKKGLDVRYFDKISYYNYEKARTFDSKFLLGFESSIYDKDLPEGYEEGKNKAEKKLKDKIINNLPGDTYRNLSISTRIREAYFKHLLVPAWVVQYTFKGKNYQILVNGQSGKIAGKKPTDTMKIILVVLAVVLIIGLLVYFFSNAQ